MLFRFRLWILVLTASSVLATGCRAPSPGAPAPAREAFLPAPASGSAADRASEDARVDAHAHYGAGIIHDLKNESELALKEYYEAALKDPANETLILEVSRLFLQAKQPEKALELLTRATAQPGASGALFGRLGFIYAQLGKPDLAIKASRTAIEKQPRSLAGYQNLFVNYLQSKQVPAAQAALDEAAKVPDTAPDFLIGLGELYVNLGLQVPAERETTSVKALALLQRAEKLRVTDTATRLRMADGFNLLGKDDKAAQIYLELLQRVSNVPYVRENVRAKLADIYLRKRDRSKATEQLEAIVRDNPTDAQAYYFLGSIAFNDNKDAQAAEYLTKTLLLDPEFEPAYYDLAAAQLGDNKAREALATLDKARQKFVQNFVMEYFTGIAWGRLKEYTNALNHFTAAEIVAGARDTNRLNHLFYFEVGATCERAGDYVQAERHFEKCLQLSPNFAEAQNYLGYMWADRGEKLERARELIDKAVQAEPKNAAYLDSMGWVLFKLNRPLEALDYIQKAIELSKKEEEDAELYNHLGDIYAAIGKVEEARAAWRKSVAIEKNETVRKKLEPGPK